jgi:hypothetical protein
MILAMSSCNFFANITCTHTRKKEALAKTKYLSKRLYSQVFAGMCIKPKLFGK